MAKTKALISFAVTAKLICVFVLAYAKKTVFSRRGSFEPRRWPLHGVAWHIQYFTECVQEVQYAASHCTISVNTLLKRFKGTPNYFPYIAVLNTRKFSPHIKAIQNDPECPLLLHHLNNASKSLTTRILIPRMSCPRPEAILAQISPNMNIGCKFESYTVCICRHEFRTRNFHVRPISSPISRKLWTQKNALTLLFSKNANAPFTWARHFLYQIS